MEIKLKKEESVLLDYSECPRCHNPFNSKKRKKTNHHVIPNFLKPKTDIEVTLCLECHNELNQCYNGQEILTKTVTNLDVNGFIEFKKRYEELQKQYHSNKINRGQFGAALWDNLMAHLEAQDKKIRKMEPKYQKGDRGKK